MRRTAVFLWLLMFEAAPLAAETLTAVRVVRPNAVISPADLGVIGAIIPGALTPDVDVVGLEARITLYPGRPILPDHVGPAALVERNQPVIVIFKSGGLTISADGRALSRGAEGETVRVMNMASRATVSGKVQPDGSVVVLSRGLNH